MYCCNSSSVARCGDFCDSRKWGCMMSDTWGMRTVALKSDFMMKSSGRVMRFRNSNRLISPQKVFSRPSPSDFTTGKPPWVVPEIMGRKC